MPIVQPRAFDALGLVPFQINPHYVDADPASRHMGETREDRLREYLEENACPVVGVREGGWLRARATRLRLGGRPRRAPLPPRRAARGDRDRRRPQLPALARIIHEAVLDLLHEWSDVRRGGARPSQERRRLAISM